MTKRHPHYAEACHAFSSKSTHHNIAASCLSRRCPQVQLKWNTQRGVSVIPKAQTPEHFRTNFEGFFDWALSDAQKVRLTARIFQ